MKHPHPTQMGILKKLLFAEGLRYTELKPSEELENNTFDFHIDQLIKEGHLLKKDGRYYLTNKGKEYAGRMDTEKTQITRQAKVSVLVFATKEIDNKTHYLLYTRLKQPFYGVQGLISGKVPWGEKITDAAERELFEEAGLRGKCQIARMRHYLVIDKKTNDLLEDKIMFFCIFRSPTGDIIPSEEGHYEWIPQNKVSEYVKKPVEDNLEELLHGLNAFDGTMQYIDEVENVTEHF